MKGRQTQKVETIYFVCEKLRNVSRFNWFLSTHTRGGMPQTHILHHLENSFVRMFVCLIAVPPLAAEFGGKSLCVPHLFARLVRNRIRVFHVAFGCFSYVWIVESGLHLIKLTRLGRISWNLCEFYMIRLLLMPNDKRKNKNVTRVNMNYLHFLDKFE